MSSFSRRQLLVYGSMLATGCAATNRHDTAALDSVSTVPPPPSPTTTTADYPDAITRHLDRLANEVRPVPDSALPPRHLDVDRFPTSLVDRERIVSGGPPPDGIPSIDSPVFVAASDVDWLADDEPVLVLDIGGSVRAYPVQILTWHEIVNDRVDGVHVAVTYCPLCNSGVAYERTLDGDVLDFGTSGALFQANLVMYDRQTESLWTQFDGRSVLGTSVGAQLVTRPLTTIAFAQFGAANPDGEVLSRETGHSKPYGRNPYVSYERRSDPVAGFYTGDVDGALAPFTRVVGVEVRDEHVAIERSALAERGVITWDMAGETLTAWHHPGTASALDTPQIADGNDIGAVSVFVAAVDGSPLTFERRSANVFDVETASTWNPFGLAVDGPLAGTQLVAVSHHDTFWFAWATFHGEPIVLDVD